jgi:hypothetical protein
MCLYRLESPPTSLQDGSKPEAVFEHPGLPITQKKNVFNQDKKKLISF